MSEERQLLLKYWVEDSEQNEPQFFLFELGTSPVIQVVVQVSVTFAKFQLLEELFVFHEIERVKNVKVILLGDSEHVQHQTGKSAGHVVVGIGGEESFVLLVVYNSGWQRIERCKIRDLRLAVFDNICIYNTFAGKEPVLKLVI